MFHTRRDNPVRKQIPILGSGSVWRGVRRGLLAAIALTLCSCASAPLVEQARDKQAGQVVFIHDNRPFAYSPPGDTGQFAIGSVGRMAGIFVALAVTGMRQQSVTTHELLSEAARQQNLHNDHRRTFLSRMDDRLRKLGIQPVWIPARFVPGGASATQPERWRPDGDFGPPPGGLMYAVHLAFGNCGLDTLRPCIRSFLIPIRSDGVQDVAPIRDRTFPDPRAPAAGAAPWPVRLDETDQEATRRQIDGLIKAYDQALADMVEPAADRFVQALGE